MHRLIIIAAAASLAACAGSNGNGGAVTDSGVPSANTGPTGTADRWTGGSTGEEAMGAGASREIVCPDGTVRTASTGAGSEMPSYGGVPRASGGAIGGSSGSGGGTGEDMAGGGSRDYACVSGDEIGRSTTGTGAAAGTGATPPANGGDHWIDGGTGQTTGGPGG